jgi:predicted XRE-type DNA-binding protein
MTKSQDLFDSIPNDLQKADLWGISPNSGEDVSIPVFLHRPKNKAYDTKWLVLWQDDAEETGMSLIELAADKRLNTTDFRVRDYLFCKVGMGNFVHISQTEASKYLGIAQPNVSSSIKKLIEMGIILEGPSKGKFKTYQVNPALAYFGGINNGQRERKEKIQESKKVKVMPFKQPQQGSLLDL